MYSYLDVVFIYIYTYVSSTLFVVEKLLFFWETFHHAVIHLCCFFLGKILSKWPCDQKHETKQRNCCKL